MRALLLEDNELRGRAMKRQLEAAGYTVCWVPTALAALEALFHATGFELATLDHDLGEGPTGQLVAEAIACMNPEFRPRRVEVHSANPAGAERMLAALRAAGVDAAQKDFLP